MLAPPTLPTEPPLLQEEAHNSQLNKPSFDAQEWQDRAFCQHYSNNGSNSFAIANHKLLQSFWKQWDNIDSISTLATTSSLPLVPSSIPNVNIDNLIECLAEITAIQATGIPTGWGINMDKFEQNRSTKPTSPDAVSLGLPQWTTRDLLDAMCQSL
ncbi:hypothetical protein B0J17DRAFT_723554 [Rhizoctonia solani]|nr:hypothetical protein B0J17DRAFT_723554 [Rhizoctonia solani]